MSKDHGVFYWLRTGLFNFNGLRRWLKKELPEVQKIAIHAGIILVQVLKAVAENPALDFFVEATKTKLDDKVLAGIKEWGPKTLLELQIGAECLGSADLASGMQCVAKFVNNLPEPIRSAKLTQIAEFWAVASSDGAITWNDIAGLLKIVYDHDFKAQEAGDPESDTESDTQ